MTNKVYYIWDGGNNSGGESWANAFQSWPDMVNYGGANLGPGSSADPLESSDLVYVAHDHTDSSETYAAHFTVYGPATVAPCRVISVTAESDPPTYQAGTTSQADTTDGNYNFVFDGSWAIYGLRVYAGQSIGADANGAERIIFYDCYLRPGLGDALSQVASVYGDVWLINCTIDDTATSVGSSASLITPRGIWTLIDCVFTNVSNRTGAIAGWTTGGRVYLEGCDLSAFDTDCELAVGGSSPTTVEVAACLLPSTFAGYVAGTYTTQGWTAGYGSGSGDSPWNLYYSDALGSLIASNAIYRTGGATVEEDACSWLITTTAACGELSPLWTRWIYGTVSSTGSKTFDLYITNDTADFTDAEVWLEIEYLSTTDEAIWALATDHRATITATAAAQTDDTTSTWNGTGPSFTYKQKLSVTATVNETGQYRARVAVGAASIASSRYFYVDPKVTVS